MEAFNFKNKTINDISVWAWAAAVAPITALSCLILIWLMDDTKLLSIAIITIGTLMVAAAVIWWWWVLYTIRQLMVTWVSTGTYVHEVLEEISDIRQIVTTPVNKELDK